MQHYLKKFTQYLPRIVAWLLILNVFGFDLFTNHTVFLLDYVPTPIRVWDRSYYASIPWIWMAHDGLLFILWYIWWSKAYLLSIVVITLLLWYHRWQYIATKHREPDSTSNLNYLPILGMIVMIFNPVFSSRMGTQPWVWLGIVLLGWGLYRLICFRDQLTTKHSIIVWLFWWSAMMSMNHASFMILVCLLILVLVLRSWRTIGSVLIIGWLVWLLNLNWIIWWLIWTNQVIQWATTFSQANIEEFMTYGQSWLWPVITSALWYGFRWEKYGSAFAPTWSNPRWWVAWVILLLLVWYGWWILYRHHARQAIYLWVVMIISLILWVGIASDRLAPLIQWLYDHVPWYRGLREPHKRIWLYIMIAIPLMLLWYRSSMRYIVPHLSSAWYVILVALIMFAWSPGSVHQLMSRYDMTDYPSSYSQTRDFLIDQWWSGQRIQLPWHSYHQCQRNNKTISNSLSTYMYPASVTVSDNIEVWQLYSNSTNPRSRAIEQWIATKDISYLSGYNIQWVIYLSQCADFNNYKWITTYSWVSQIADYGDVQIYRIKSNQ